jgi:uncharacterized membrane protein
MAHVAHVSGHLRRRADAPADRPALRTVAAAQPLRWLKAGWDDLSHHPSASVAGGLAVAALGAALIVAGRKSPHLAPALVGGFLLVAPMAALPFHALSRQRLAGERPDLQAAMAPGLRNISSLALFGLLLTLAFLAWERVGAVTFALLYGGRVPDLSNLVADVLLSGHYSALAIAFCGMGALFAAGVFVIGAVSAQMLLDREDSDLIGAIATSIRACQVNPGPMLVWAGLIAGLMAVGYATALLGLVVIFPLLGHASWHAYRDLVAPGS